MFALGSIVYDGCLGDSFEAIVLQSSNSNDWVGTVEYKTGQEESYVHMRCENCEEGSGPENTIMVSRNSNANDHGASLCGSACTLVRAARKIV